MDKTKYKIRKILEALKKQRGRHTELITVYIPPDTDVNQIINQLQQEQGTAVNIKSKQTRKNVTDALEKIVQHLRLYKHTPKHGLAVFCGNIAEQEGQQDLEIWAIEPSDPVDVKMYRCDQTFVTEPLEKLMMPKNGYALIAIDNKQATLGMLRGANYQILDTMTSGYSGKHRAGGQSHRRFERLIAEESHRFKQRVADHAENLFLSSIQEIAGVIIGGPAGTKDEFIDGPYLHYELKKKIVAVKDITYTDESGVRELVNEATEDIKEVEATEHRKYIQRFMKYLNTEPGMVAYGLKEVKNALDVGAVEVLMLSDNLDDDKLDELIDKAELSGVRAEIITDEFEEGNQLWVAFGGVAAILRYALS
jgi:peptide chain release factor subunit 1